VQVLAEEKKFAEAFQFIEASKEDDTLRQQLKRQTLTRQFEETHDDAVLQKIMETYTGEEKVAIAALRDEAAQANKIANVGERMDLLFDILQEQFQVMDITGARQTLKLIAEQIGKETEPAQIIQYRLLLAPIQIELRDKAGTKENLGKLMQTLDVKDLKVFKNLVPEQQPERAPAVTAEGRLRLDLPSAAVDESAIRSQLFHVYVRIAELLASADAPVESKSAFEKAKALARLEPAALQRAEKLLVLAQFLAE
jgi:hypothetical protein